MAIKVKKYPRSKKVDINSVSSDGGYDMLSVNGSYEEYYVGMEIAVFCAAFAGKYTITAVSNPAGTTILLTTTRVYTANSTGFLFTDVTIPNNSAWQATKNTPLYFEFQRQDITIVSITSYYSTQIHITITGDYSTFNLAAGQNIYVEAYNDTTGVLLYDDIGQIGSIYFDGTLSHIYLNDITFNGSSTTGFINSNNYLEDYYLQLVLSSSKFDSDITAKFYPDLKGLIYADLHAFLEATLSLEDNYNHYDESYKDTNLYGYFNLTYQEIYDGGSGSVLTISEYFYFNYSRRQLGDYANLFRFLCKSGDENPIGKMLNKGIPSIYVDSNGVPQLPFDLSFISRPGVLAKIEKKYNESKAEQASTSFNLEEASNALNRMRISATYAPATIKYLGIYIQNSLEGIWQFYKEIDFDGVVDDNYLIANGQLVEARCIYATTNTILRFSQEIAFDWTTLTHDGTATIAGSGSTITCSAGGTIYNLSVQDLSGNTYDFSCSEVWGDFSELHTNANAASDPNANESDAITGFYNNHLNGRGNNVFESQSIIVNKGNYALHANANDTPFINARFYADLNAAPFSCVSGKGYKLSFEARHVGSGGDWRIYLNTLMADIDNIIVDLSNSDIIYKRYVYEWIHNSKTRWFMGKENNLAYDGGIYFDNFSVKETIKKYSYLLHGLKNSSDPIYAFTENCSFDIQDNYHNLIQVGTDKNVNQSDNTQKIWVPKDQAGNEMYVKGLDDDNFTIGNGFLIV